MNVFFLYQISLYIIKLKSISWILYKLPQYYLYFCSNPKKMLKFLNISYKLSASRTRFQHACKAIHRFANVHNMPKLTYEQQIQLYGLEKQALEGDNQTKKDLSTLKGKEEDKFEAWEKCRGKRERQAQEEYVTLVKDLLKKYHAEQFIHQF